MSNWLELWSLESGESIGTREVTYSSGEPECPTCGRPMEYEEFVYSQDRQGSDEYACHHACYHCLIATESVGI